MFCVACPSVSAVTLGLAFPALAIPLTTAASQKITAASQATEDGRLGEIVINPIVCRRRNIRHQSAKGIPKDIKSRKLHFVFRGGCKRGEYFADAAVSVFPQMYRRNIRSDKSLILSFSLFFVIISAGFSTIANCFTFPVTTVLLAITSFYICPSTSLTKRNGSLSAPVF